MISAQQLAKAVEVPQLNELGYTKRYVRCLQVGCVLFLLVYIIDSWLTSLMKLSHLIDIKCVAWF